ncbi:MAG: hypothetical protein VB949_02455 [Pseudomonadales bacterium]
MQALALELIWSHLHEVDYLFEVSLTAAIAWLQIGATLLGIVLIWVIYSGNVMRFRWVPATADSVFPYFIGLAEFMLIETLGPDKIGVWLLLMALVFVMMNWVSYKTMVMARQDSDNDAYFGRMGPAQLRDFYPGIAIVSGLTLAGGYILASGDTGVFAMLALLATIAALSWQFRQAAMFWALSVTEFSGQE